MNRDVACRPLPLSFYAGSALDVAPRLIGCVLCSLVDSKLVGGVIVETEAYLEDDPASHSYGGPTPRNRSMFGPPGRAYVYRSYGVHWCLNIVTGEVGVGEAVLIRALEPLVGLEAAYRRRGVQDARLLFSGPGRLCQALAVDRTFDGLPLSGPPLWVEEGPPSARKIEATSRIGISAGKDRLWRFFDVNSPFCSRRTRSKHAR